MMPVSVVASWRLWAVPLLAAAAAGYAAWFIQAVRLDAAKSEHAREIAVQRARLEAARTAAMEAARVQEVVLNTKINEATHVHQKALAQARADGRAARTELDRLRHALAATDRLPGDPAGAGHLDTSPARELLGECAAAYLDLAEQADGHAADARLLLDGWPR